MSDQMCESCGSNIGPASPGTYLHLCSIKTAKGWRQEVPLHARRRPLIKAKARYGIADPRDWDLYEAWLKQHEDADALIADNRSGLVIQAVYDNPTAMTVSSTLDFFTNAARLSDGPTD